jgi:ABC-2 type transport system ATP-binding protein
MAEAQIVLKSLEKVYRVHEREAGVGASIRSLFQRKYKDVRAVDSVSFTVEAGEIVGFLGPNGAGKTTTLKILSGLLHPTGGEAHVLGHVPWKRESAYLKNIGLVMGNRNQLTWDIPALDSFSVNQAVYAIPEADYRQTLKELVELLELGDVIKKPVRNLSLGERMKCELAASLLHRPKVLFLDEPTLGVDVSMQVRIRQFIAEHNAKYGATILLTSHYMADVTALCKRIIVIHRGRLLYDGPIDALSERIAPFKLVTVDVENAEAAALVAQFGEVVEQDGLKVTLRLPRTETAAVVARLLQELPILDLTVADPPIEAVIEQVFQEAPKNEVLA